jgi:hypothetical protein
VRRSPAPRAVLGALALAGLAACGYGFSQRYHAKGGVDRVHVRAIENLSADPDLGVAVTSALRDELARRGADGGEDAPAHIEGDVRSLEGTPSSVNGETWRMGVILRARLIVRGEAVAEQTVRRDADHLGGADALETEGRRAIALRKLAGDAAHDLLRTFEQR